MLVMTDEVVGYLREVKEFARSQGLLEQLEGHLARLQNYSDNSVVELYKDFAPHSFSFLIKVRGKDGRYHPWINGGLIYSGPTQPLDGSFPALTVSLGTPTHGWSVHT